MKKIEIDSLKRPSLVRSHVGGKEMVDDFAINGGLQGGRFYAPVYEGSHDLAVGREMVISGTTKAQLEKIARRPLLFCRFHPHTM